MSRKSIYEQYSAFAREKRKKLIDRVSIASMAAITLSSIPDAYYGIWTTVGISLFGIIILCIGYFFNQRGNSEIVGNLLLSVLSVLIFGLDSMMGAEALIFLYYIPLVIFVPFVINYQRRLQVAFHLFHPLFFVIILIRTEHSLFILPEVTKEQAALVGAFNTIILILVSHYIISEIIRVTSRAEASLFRSEAQLKEQNIELQKINEELDAFVYSLGHDLRAPVASALGLVNISKDEQDITTLHQYNLLKEKSLLRLDSFIEDILHYARNARTGVKTEDVHLSAEIRNTVLLNQMSAEAQHIQIIFELNDTIVLSTDRYRLGLILNNLISNAFRYHNPHMAHPWILIKTIDQKDSVEIIVQDNGIGIGEEHLDKIFQIFYQANDRVKSSGLGLYILKEAVHRLQGEVSVASELDRGTTFCVELPKNRT